MLYERVDVCRMLPVIYRCLRLLHEDRYVVPEVRSRSFLTVGGAIEAFDEEFGNRYV